MADDTSITTDLALIPPGEIARRKRVSREKVNETAKALGISFHITAAGRQLASFRQSVRIARHIDAIAKK